MVDRRRGKIVASPAAAAYLAIAVVLYVVVALFAHTKLPVPYRESVRPANYSGPSALEGWVRYDAGWYRSIADDGYFYRGKAEQSSVAFFPFYPLTMRAGHRIIGGDTAAWGVFITFVCGFAIALLFYRWTVPRVGRRVGSISLLCLLLWPYAWYVYGAVYADALFIALVLGAFLALERGWLLLSAGFGALATATRPVGVAVMLGLVVRQLEREGVLHSLSMHVKGAPWLDRRRLRWRDGVPLLSIAGFVAYIVYLWVKFDEPLAFAKAEAAPGWDLKPGPHTWFKVDLFHRLADFPHNGPYHTANLVVQGVLALCVVASAPLVVRRFGWGYGVYVFAVMAIPVVGSKDFQGLGRYALAAFPTFALAGEWLASRRRLTPVALGASGAALVVLCSAFARGAYLS